MNDKMTVDNTLNALKVIIEQNDVHLKYIYDIRNLLVALCKLQGIKIEPAPEVIASNYQPMDDLLA